MINIPLKKLESGFTMPAFGIGTWKMGGDDHRNPENNDSLDIQAIRNAIDAGITHIDTAERYADGFAEKFVGEAIQGHRRNKLFIVSKVWKTHLKYDDVLKACEGSLRRIKTDYLDLYLIHMPDPKVPIAETMRAMDRLKKEGLIRNIGVSDFTKDRMIKAQAATRNKIVATQVHYNLIFREPERAGVLNYCQKNDVMLIAWRPVQQGALTKSGIQILDLMGKKYKKTPAQIAINWLISQQNVVTLVKMRSRKNLEENLEAIGWTLDREDVERLRTEFPDQKDISNAVPLQ